MNKTDTKKYFKLLLLLLVLFILFLVKSNSILFIKENSSNNYEHKWPINSTKNTIQGSNLNYECNDEIKEIGCNCYKDSDCINQNCVKYPNTSYCSPKNGDIFPEFVGTDQYNQKVNLYNFGNQNKYIIIELATTWCKACKTLADWLANDNLEIKNKRWWKDEYIKVKELIQNNELYYITILYEKNDRKLPNYLTAQNWFKSYPEENIPILIDEKKEIHKWVKPTGIPTTILLNEKMEIVNFSTRGINSSFDKVLKIIK